MFDIKNHEHPFPHIIIENIYSDDELDLIWEELDFLCHPHKLKEPSLSESAFDDDGLMKKNKLLFLDSVYSDRNFSNIMTINRKIFEILKCANHPHWIFTNFDPTLDTTMISYYENEGYYKKHQDSTILTALTWFYKEPKKFEGGNVVFSCNDVEVEIKCNNNRAVIFPGIIHHQVKTVHMDKEYLNKRCGRFCMSQFMSYSHRNENGELVPYI